jgi:hypothetical protein
MNHGLQSVRSKLKGSQDNEVDKLASMISEVSKRAQKLESGGGFIF